MLEPLKHVLHLIWSAYVISTANRTALKIARGFHIHYPARPALYSYQRCIFQQNEKKYVNLFPKETRGRGGGGFGQKAHFFGFLIPSLKTICPTVAPRCSHSQFSFKKWLTPVEYSQPWKGFFAGLTPLERKALLLRLKVGGQGTLLRVGCYAAMSKVSSDPIQAPRCSHSQFSFKKWLRPTVAKFVHVQNRRFDKIFSTPITIYSFSPVSVNMCLTWEVGFGNIYFQNSKFPLWKWLRPSVAKFMHLQNSGCDKIFPALITKPMF